MPAAVQDFYYAAFGSPSFSRTVATKPTASVRPQSHSGRSSTMPAPSRELPMPTVTRITGLTQAYATLQHCWIRLSKPQQSAVQSIAPMDVAERRYFQRWLAQWEEAFTAYLSFAMAGMHGEDITRCRILKASHLACQILASDGGSDSRSFDVFEPDFKGIVDLAAAVLQSRRPAAAALSSTTATLGVDAAAGRGLDVKDPLRVVIERCRQTTLRNQAIGLLHTANAR